MGYFGWDKQAENGAEERNLQSMIVDLYNRDCRNRTGGANSTS